MRDGDKDDGAEVFGLNGKKPQLPGQQGIEHGAPTVPEKSQGLWGQAGIKGSPSLSAGRGQGVEATAEELLQHCHVKAGEVRR